MVTFSILAANTLMINFSMLLANLQSPFCDNKINPITVSVSSYQLSLIKTVQHTTQTPHSLLAH